MREIQITAGSRLHFGLLAPSAGHARRFGGVGVMIDNPLVRLLAASADQFTAVGPGADRVVEFAKRWSLSRGETAPPNCRIVVQALPRMHAGLGVGTQLGLSVARILNEWVGQSQMSPAELARSVGRGNRSAVGTYGFHAGGLIAELGKSTPESLAPLDVRLELPDVWQWLLVCPRAGDGLHGRREHQAFAEMREPANDVASELLTELCEQLLPAARRGDFPGFSSSLRRYGYQSGMSFASVQGGAYNGPRLHQIVEAIRQLGIEGVGQSSWGPTIFALCPTAAVAQSIADRLKPTVSDSDILISGTCNHGARIE